MSEFKCPVHPHIINEKCCAESVEVKPEEPSVQVLTGDVVESNSIQIPIGSVGDIVLPNVVPTEVDDHLIPFAYDIDFLFMMLLCLPTWLIYWPVKERFTDGHPWTNKHFTLRAWTEGSTKLTKIFSAGIWIYVILSLSILLHLLRK